MTKQSVALSRTDDRLGSSVLASARGVRAKAWLKRMRRMRQNCIRVVTFLTATLRGPDSTKGEGTDTTSPGRRGLEGRRPEGGGMEILEGSIATERASNQRESMRATEPSKSPNHGPCCRKRIISVVMDVRIRGGVRRGLIEARIRKGYRRKSNEEIRNSVRPWRVCGAT